MKSLIAAMIVFGSVNAFAQKGEHPCKEIKSACESAGFVKGEHKEKKGLYKDCMQPVMAGQSVAGVNVSADVVSACKAKKAEHTEHAKK
ncbi:hypothetical protein [Bdellovibrio svalbardensis]|uniref:Phosphate starvation-inducible protein PsiF n=1 Tax=Bdellovibrio svalbardensis TaxID=2972972 RepID=A0ABT6DIG9_9BACT|nr:hypothetical protein [Bdellovibrio svalbardensis]MDG0816644.1 hypothetical protein [Bdellovibrio svalbardensis]